MKNKKLFKILSLVFTAMLLFNLTPNLKARAQADYMKGVWVATVYGLDYPHTPSRQPALLKAQADEILDKCEELGYNTIFLQVHASADALHHSKLFPYSKFLTGKQGDAPYNNFDPLDYWVGEAHKRNMELHAWINPYRVTTEKIKLTDLAKDNPARLHPEYTFLYTDGKYYFNPAMPQVRKLIIDCVNEIIENYAVDGIHLDDYFYPGSDLNDMADYLKYNSKGMSIEDWRRSNCDRLVKEISETSRAHNVTFGISPSGIWANKSTHPKGSDTYGGESYTELFADTRKWALEGWVDYIAPQIYWEIGNTESDYETLLNWWSDTLAKSETKLYIGIPDYKCDRAESGSVWYGGRAVREQLALNSLNNRINGEIHFRYDSVINNPSLYEIVKEYNEVGFIAKDDIKVLLNGAYINFDVKPIILNNRTLVPMRAIFEALGMEVMWDGESRSITALNGKGDKIEMAIGKKEIGHNGKIISLDTAPIVVRGRTLVPVRAISESLGAKVNWLQEAQTVKITAE